MFADPDDPDQIDRDHRDVARAFVFAAAFVALAIFCAGYFGWQMLRSAGL
jgi:hypothetical protein